MAPEEKTLPHIFISVLKNVRGEEYPTIYPVVVKFQSLLKMFLSNPPPLSKYFFRGDGLLTNLHNYLFSKNFY